MKISEHVINSPAEMSEIFNSHFSGIGDNLAAEIPQTDVDPESYIFPTYTKFSFQDPTVNLVHKLLSGIKERKATGLDNIPCKLLKMAAHIVAPSLTKILIKSISTNISPKNWKLARVFSKRLCLASSKVIVMKKLIESLSMRFSVFT